MPLLIFPFETPASSLVVESTLTVLGSDHLGAHYLKPTFGHTAGSMSIRCYLRLGRNNISISAMRRIVDLTENVEQSYFLPANLLILDFYSQMIWKRSAPASTGKLIPVIADAYAPDKNRTPSAISED